MSKSDLHSLLSMSIKVPPFSSLSCGQMKRWFGQRQRTRTCTTGSTETIPNHLRSKIINFKMANLGSCFGVVSVPSVLGRLLLLKAQWTLKSTSASFKTTFWMRFTMSSLNMGSIWYSCRITQVVTTILRFEPDWEPLGPHQVKKTAKVWNGHLKVWPHLASFRHLGRVGWWIRFGFITECFYTSCCVWIQKWSAYRLLMTELNCLYATIYSGRTVHSLHTWKGLQAPRITPQSIPLKETSRHSKDPCLCRRQRQKVIHKFISLAEKYPSIHQLDVIDNDWHKIMDITCMHQRFVYRTCRVVDSKWYTVLCASTQWLWTISVMDRRYAANLGIVIFKFSA